MHYLLVFILLHPRDKHPRLCVRGNILCGPSLAVISGHNWVAIGACGRLCPRFALIVRNALAAPSICLHSDRAYLSVVMTTLTADGGAHEGAVVGFLSYCHLVVGSSVLNNVPSFAVPYTGKDGRND